MNIFHFGCSFTAYKLKNDDAVIVPTHVKQFLKTHGINANYYMLAAGASSIGQQYDLLLNLLKNNNYQIDYVNFQITFPGRDFTKVKEPILDKTTEQLGDGYIRFDREQLESYRWYNGTNCYPAKYQDRSFSNFVKQIIKYGVDDYQKWLGYILLTKRILEANEIKHTFYSHCHDRQKGLYLPSSIEDLADDYLDFDVSKILGDTFDSYIADQGLHFGTDGNRLVAEILTKKMLDNI